MDFTTPFDFAKIFNISHQTVLNLIRQKKIKAIKVGGQFRIPKSEVERIKNNSN